MEEKRVLIVGAGSCIAGELMRRVAARGGTVLATARSEPDALPEGAVFRSADVLEESLPDEFLSQPLDGLVYCPGTVTLKPLRSLKEEDFLRDYRINVLGAVRVLKSAYKALREAPGASVVLFSSVAVQTGMPYHASIAGAKAAVEGLVRSLAAEWAPNIRVNAVAPSLTDTPLVGRLLGDDHKREVAAHRHPLQRVGKPEDVSAAAEFLLSAESAWITGQVLPVDGGLSSVRLFSE